MAGGSPILSPTHWRAEIGNSGKASVGMPPDKMRSFPRRLRRISPLSLSAAKPASNADISRVRANPMENCRHHVATGSASMPVCRKRPLAGFTCHNEIWALPREPRVARLRGLGRCAGPR
jgi:hypothetical protein